MLSETTSYKRKCGKSDAITLRGARVPTANRHWLLFCGKRHSTHIHVPATMATAEGGKRAAKRPRSAAARAISDDDVQVDWGAYFEHRHFVSVPRYHGDHKQDDLGHGDTSSAMQGGLLLLWFTMRSVCSCCVVPYLPLCCSWCVVHVPQARPVARPPGTTGGVPSRWVGMGGKSCSSTLLPQPQQANTTLHLCGCGVCVCVCV